MHATQKQGARGRRLSAHDGFTMLEVLIATVITLILTGLVVQMFTVFSDGIFNSRANIELSDNLRNARHRLVQDLRGVTAPTVPPLDPSAEMGYFEYVEGANVANQIGGDFGIGSISGGASITTSDTISGDRDDILMFTTCSFDDPLIGRSQRSKTLRARFAEVAWFVRPVAGQSYCTLYRRVFLIDPQSNVNTTANNDYSDMDVSAHSINTMFERLSRWTLDSSILTVDNNPALDANGLGELTQREFRSLHQPFQWPYEMMYVSGTTIIGYGGDNWPANTAPLLGLPVLMETSVSVTTTTGSLSSNPYKLLIAKSNDLALPNPMITETSYNGNTYLKSDFSLSSGTPKYGPSTRFLHARNSLTTASASREGEDAILVDVIGFDVKAWDPGAPVFRADAEPTTATSVGNPGVIGLIAPGDAGYGGYGAMFDTTTPRGALANFIANPKQPVNQPVAFGAFVDLNYMWLFCQSGNTNVKSNNSAMNSYLSALGQFEMAGVVRNDGYVRLPRPSFAFATPGRVLSGYPGDNITGYQLPSVYDTWSRHYEYDGIDNDGDGVVDEGTNGIDDDGDGFVDEMPTPFDKNNNGMIDGSELALAEQNAERDAPPPWDAPLRGIKVTIRVMEQDSRQVREVATVHEFIPY